MNENRWLLLTYKVPPDPASRRVALWRRLKGMGAIYLQNGVCVLPRNDDHVRRLKMLENEVRKMGGESVILETAALDSAQEEKVIARFKMDRDDEYREFIGRCQRFEEEIAKEFSIEKFTYAELEEEDADLKKLQSWFERIKKLDFYGGDLAEQAVEKLRACEAVLETYAQRVFEVQDEIMGKPTEAPEGASKATPKGGAAS